MQKDGINFSIAIQYFPQFSFYDQFNSTQVLTRVLSGRH